MNPDSPYYGWPIAFDGNSMLWYLVLGEKFPSYIFSWYADMPFTITPKLLERYIGIGYRGENFTTAFTTVSLANIPDDYERAVIINNTLNWFGNVTNVLLVDDDGGDIYEFFYLISLNMLGVNYTYYDVWFNENFLNETGPSLELMSNYSLVIWFTGGAYDTITYDDIELWKAYLNNGGKLWLISEDYLYTYEKTSFTLDYLHVLASVQDVPVPTIIEDYTGERYYGGEVYWGAYISPTDIFADYIVPDSEAEPLLTGYTAFAYSPDFDEILFDVKLPLDKDLNVPSVSGEMKLGYHPDLALWAYWAGGYVLVTDSEEAGKYDTVYVDLLPSTVIDFNKDVGHTKDNPVVQLDFLDTLGGPLEVDTNHDGIPDKGISIDINGDGINDGWFGQDGYADLSGGLIYFIADGETPIPYSDVVAERWGIPLKIPEAGELVAFMIGTDFTYGGDHGTLCAAAVAARGRTYYGYYYSANTYGTAPGAKIIAEGSLYSGGIWLDYIFFAVEGYDGIPGTGDEALVVSNSYGNSYVINKGYDWEDRFLYWITSNYTPWVSFLFAAGNGGPGYGTVTSNGASPGVITVGAAVEYGYRNLYGYDGGPLGFEYANYGDVAGFSNRGPNALGQVDPDVLAVGMFAAGSLPVNSVGNGVFASDLWAGTSLATPMAAGITALVYQAYYEAHGTLPTAQEVKEILMSTADNVNHDVFSQGAGFLNAYRAVKAAMELDGIIVSPSMWQAGETEYPAFANIMYPGESAEKVFEIRNANTTANKEVEVSAEIFKKVGEYTFTVNSSQFGELIRIDQYLPEDVDLLKVTVYTPYEQFLEAGYIYAELFAWTDVNGNGTVEFWYETNRIQSDVKAGTTLSLTLGNPRSKFVDGLLFRLRNGGEVNYVKLEFYKRVPWSWVEITPETVLVPANGTAVFSVKLTVPEDTAPGIYEGAIYLKYDGVETTVPVSVVVAAPVPEFEFGGYTNSTGLYDNSNVYGYMDWWWRYESGDWRLFYFNVPEDMNVSETYIITDVAWDGAYPTDINLHVLGPLVDDWSMMNPDVFGPYTLYEIARSDDSYMGSGRFAYKTTSGGPREIIAAPAQNGLHAVWLHNVLFDGLSDHRTFYGRIGTAKVTPSAIEAVVEEPDGEFNVLFKRSYDFGNLTTDAYGLIIPEKYLNVLAPPTEESHFYVIQVNESGQLDVVLTSIYDDLAGLDLDLYVYYTTDFENLETVGSSTSPYADERVTIDFPEPGYYIIEVYSWYNPAFGDTYYDLYIYDYEKKNVDTSVAKVDENEYSITVGYSLHEPNFVQLAESGEPLLGKLFIGSVYAPTLIQVPMKVIISNASLTDIEVSSMSIEPDVIEVGDTANVTFILRNRGEKTAYDVVVELLDENGNVLASDTINEFAPSDVYEAYYIIPLNDTEIHSFTIVVKALNDRDESNNKYYFTLSAAEPGFLMNEGDAYVPYTYSNISAYGEVVKVEPLEITDSGGSYGISANLAGEGKLILVLPGSTENVTISVIRPWAYYSLLLNPFDDVSLGQGEVPYVITVNGTPKFNPFAVQKVREALNKLISRNYVVESIIGENTTPMYGPVKYWDALYGVLFSIYNMTGVVSYDEEQALTEIDEALSEAAEELAKYNYTLEKVNGTWLFNGEPVTITGIGRVEDFRQDIAHYIADLLEKAGIHVELNIIDRSTAGLIVYVNPDYTKNFTWAFYTEGWISGRILNKDEIPEYLWWFYAPYGFYPSWAVRYYPTLTVSDVIAEFGGYNETIEGLRLYYYDTPEKLAMIANFTVVELTDMLMNATDDDQKLDLEKLIIYLGIKDGVRDFIAATYEGANDIIKGYDLVDYEGKKLLIIAFENNDWRTGFWFTVDYKLHVEQYTEEVVEEVEEVEETIENVVETVQDVIEELTNVTETGESIEETLQVLEEVTEENPEVIEEVAEQLNMTVEEVQDIIEDTHVEQIDEQTTALMVIASELNGDAEIVKDETDVTVEEVKEGREEVKKAEAKIVVDGDHGTVVTLAIKLPLDIDEYNVTVNDADLLGTQLIPKDTYSLLVVTIRLHSPAEVDVTAIDKEEERRQINYVQTLNFINYMYYKKYIKEFENLYNKSVELGIDNAIIQEALNYKQIAEQYFKAAEGYGPIINNLGNPRILMPLRKAYLNMKKAVEILEKATEEAESS
ncbi:hypothetical protein E3E31_00650 [Thermococcus sp. M39]|uniref:S8 family serine peptidase n=1 Tax=unclassified Thermococcus TaxID=2627626 RepID=UPI001439D32B|nr:hypothetical protein [Thermococcus sp. M39]NJE13601.1 hypothetical protein [Thermococcus sp. LS2]